MSLTETASENRKWGGLPLLRFLSGESAGDEYSSSVDYRYEERIGDMLMLFKIFRKHLKNIRVNDDETSRDIKREINFLKEEFAQVSKNFHEISIELSSLIDSIKIEKGMTIQVRLGNIVAQPDADAVVNSANANLRFGSGVSGAIHTAAGDELEDYCKPFPPLDLGQALLTPGFKLINPWIIHLRSAHYINDESPEQTMRHALENMLKVVHEHQITSIAIPAIGTGIFKFPVELAAQITAEALVKAASLAPLLQWARICLADEKLIPIYKKAVFKAQQEN
jgi:O-acetyl-ADP-ribose deacetylase (regulator of RNase III)